MDEANKLDFFSNLLKNERGFHGLFSELEKFDDFVLYHNEVFSEDPVFNHFVISESLLGNNSNLDDSRIEKTIQSAASVAQRFSLGTSIFLEDFWLRSEQFEKMAIALGYRVKDKMEILSKIPTMNVQEQGATSIEVSSTREIEAWTDVFMSSFSIPESWEKELLRREQALLHLTGSNFILATERGHPVGCLLTYTGPIGYTGIYCVGTIPDHRGRGVAKQMLAFSENYALKIQSRFLTLQTLNSDHVSPMYKKLGYTKQFERRILWEPLVLTDQIAR
jgi:ribosomal protein S18 acetylase RimI-like enzyme